ncbi:hypothetical protein WDW86_00840 [Bdellovibrionota bacterium FG-2]
MESKPYLTLLNEQMVLAVTAAAALRESVERSSKVLARLASQPASSPAIEERETLEAATARFSRLSDLLFQRLFRTLDQVELNDEGSHIDRLNRMEKRGVISSAAEWRMLRQLRNDIVHEYLIEASGRVVHEAIRMAPELLNTVERTLECVKKIEVS